MVRAVRPERVRLFSGFQSVLLHVLTLDWIARHNYLQILKLWYRRMYRQIVKRLSACQCLEGTMGPVRPAQVIVMPNGTLRHSGLRQTTMHKWLRTSRR